MIHKYRSNGYNICLDVCSGAVHVLDDIAFELLDYAEDSVPEQIPAAAVEGLSDRWNENELTQCWAELHELYKAGQLFAEDEYRTYAESMVNATVKSMCLNISHDCNLACEYCFAHKGDFGGARELMSEEVGKKAINNYKKLVAGRGDKDYYVRATYTAYNLDFAEDVMHLYEQGFNNLSEEPVVTDERHPYAILPEHYQKIFDEYDRLALKIIDMKKRGESICFFHFMIDLDQGPCAIRRLRGCSCGNEYIAVTPSGDIYPCHNFVGQEQWLMGSVLDGSFNTDMKNRFASAHLYNKEGCSECWARFYCSGGCNANNNEHCGDILKPYPAYCELEKKRLESSIMIQVALADK